MFQASAYLVKITSSLSTASRVSPKLTVLIFWFRNSNISDVLLLSLNSHSENSRKYNFMRKICCFANQQSVLMWFPFTQWSSAQLIVQFTASWHSQGSRCDLQWWQSACWPARGSTSCSWSNTHARSTPHSSPHWCHGRTLQRQTEGHPSVGSTRLSFRTLLSCVTKY